MSHSLNIKGLHSLHPFTTIASRLLLGFIGIALLPALIISSVSVVSSLRHSRKQILNQLESVASLKEAEIGTWLDTLTRFIPTLTAGPRIEAEFNILLAQEQESENIKNDLRKRFRQMMEHSLLFEDILLLDINGRVILSTTELREGHILKNQTFFKQGFIGNYLQPPIYSPRLRKMIVIAAIPIINREGHNIGVIAGQADISTLNKIMNERTGLGESGETYLVGANYAIITKGYPDSTNKDLGQIVFIRTEGTEKAIKDHLDGSGFFQGYRGKPVIGVYRWIPELQMALLAEQAQSEAFQDTYNMLVINIIIAVISVLIAFALSLSITREISTPLTNLVEFTMQITSGNREIRAPVMRKDEIGILAQTFNNMVENIQKTENDILHLQRLLQNITDSMPSALITLNKEGEVLTWNPAAESLTGHRAEKVQGQSLWQTCPELERYYSLFKQVINEKQKTHQHKEQLVSESGTIYRDINIYPLISDGINGAVLRIDDITQRIKLEEMIIQSEKMMTVGGLAAGMAHEINNPLAGMIQTAGVMANRLCDKSNIPANEKAAAKAGISMEAIKSFMEDREIPRMISSIKESGQRVAAIVDNMLSFARKNEDRVSSHSLEELIDKTLVLAATDYDLKKKYDFKMIEIKKEYEGNLPDIPCEETMIQQVLLNILQNGAHAMYKAGIKKPRFTLRTYLKEKYKRIRIEIEDNGPGMDEETLRRVFEPFFTTKPAGIGTGLGLSLSYFIITQNHGGELTVESQPGKGSKFIIRLPLDRKQFEVGK